MLTSPDRRTEARRTPNKVLEPLERRRDRREGDRRDAARVRRMMTLVDCANGNRFDVEGFVSLEGVSWSALERPEGEAVEAWIQLPDLIQPLRLLCRIGRLAKSDGWFEVHARFPELSVAAELSLARFIEERSRLESALTEQ